LTPFFSDLFWTLLTQGFVLVAGLLLFKLAADAFGPDGFGVYQLSRRIAALTQPIVLLGLGVGLPRYIGMVLGSRPEKLASLAVSAGISIVLMALIVAVLFNAFPQTFSLVLFGSPDYSSYAAQISLLVFGLALHALVYSYYRGHILMKMANLIQAIGIGVLPVVFLLAISECTVKQLIGLTGLGLCATACTFGLPIVREILSHRHDIRIRESARELLRYGLPRIPGDFALAALLGTGPVVASHFAKIREVGYLSTGQSLLWLTTASFTPLGIVLLPRVSNLLARGKMEVVRENLDYLVSATFHLSLFLVVQVVIFLDIVVRYWLGDEFVEGTQIMRVVVLALPFHLVYVAMRSPIDAAVVKAVNTRNLIVSLCAFLAVAGVTIWFRQMVSPALGLGIAFTSGFCVLGILTCLSAKRMYDISFNFRSFLLVIPLSFMLGMLGHVLKIYLSPGIIGIVQLAVVEVCFLVIYIFLLARCGVEWPGKFISKIMVRIQEK
jgi:O-antigen/teichoic acid export membrane protein